MLSLNDICSLIDNEKLREINMWNSPKIRELAVGLEINCYACAEL